MMDIEWTIEKIVRCMKEIVHEEVSCTASFRVSGTQYRGNIFWQSAANAEACGLHSRLSKTLAEMFIFQMFPDIKIDDFKGSVLDLQNFMDYLYQEWPQKMLYYGLPQQFEQILMDLRKVPELHKDPKISYEDFKNQLNLDLAFAYSDENQSNVTFMSKQDMCQSLQKYFEHPILFDRTTNLSPMFCSEYVHMFAYEKYQKLEGTFQLESQREYLTILIGKEPVEGNDKGISREDFEDLRKYYTKSDTSFNILMSIFENWNKVKPIEKNQEWYMEQYQNILGTIQKMRKYESLLSPRTSLGEYPIVRVFTENQFKFVLAKEAENALIIATRKKYPEKECARLLNYESEDDRKLGILNAMKIDVFYRTIEILGLTPKDLNLKNTEEKVSSSLHVPGTTIPPFFNGHGFQESNHLKTLYLRKTTREAGTIQKEEPALAGGDLLVTSKPKISTRFSRCSPITLQIVVAPIQPKIHGGYLPIISTYGKHCMFSDDAFREIMQYLSKILKVFQRCKKDQLPKIYDWINVNLTHLFSEKKYRYLIETWKIREIINQARQDLSIYITNQPFYQVPDAVQYTKSEVLNHVRKLLGSNIQFNAQLFETFYQNLDEPGCPFVYHDIYEIYHNFVVTTINNQNMAFMRFITSQLAIFADSDGQSAIIVPDGSYLQEPQPSISAPKVKKDEEFSCFKKGFLKSKRLEVVDNKNPDKKKITTKDFDAAANQILGFSPQTLAYFSNEEFRPIREFKTTIEEHFRDFFSVKLWNILKSIFEDDEEMRRLMRCIDHLYETKEDQKLGLMFKKLKVYKLDEMQRMLFQEIEEEEMIEVNNIRKNQKPTEIKTEKLEDLEKIRKELEESKNEKSKLSEILKSLRKELENQKRRFQEDLKNSESAKLSAENELKKSQEENAKLAENLKNSESAKLAAENELKKSQEENAKLAENLKNSENSKLAVENELRRSQEENGKLAENLKNSKLAVENELRRSREENAQLAENLSKSEIAQSTAENELKRLSGSLEQTKDDLAKVTQEFERLKNNNETTGNLEEFEKWFEEGLERLKSMKSASKSQEKLKNLEQILRTDYDDIIDGISANLNEILRRSPNSSEARKLKKQVDDFDENYDDYLKKIRREVRRIRENRGENGEKEENIDEFPSQEFMERYRKLLGEYRLEL
ncbi:unnamed protein product [Caenorhabditis angaria]|uniref:Uncharacterized protein n=1 Tax=Caenorhabditis angaria TaxID=860376 RepID=A0A9P1IGX5_9PELO|nr:unnamed protein product [Caenorhabditis angaria]